MLQYVRAEKEALLSEQKAEAQSSAEEMDQLLSTLTSVTAERDQLKMDLQENVKMVSDLVTALPVQILKMYSLVSAVVSFCCLFFYLHVSGPKIIFLYQTDD